MAAYSRSSFFSTSTMKSDAGRVRTLYSVEQVAERLGLHVRTVRNYVRDGRLKAVRIGKQYRIAREDLEALTGHPAAAPGTESEHASSSCRGVEHRAD